MSKINATPIPNDFNPGITHPGYLTRHGLYTAIQKHAPVLMGQLMDFGCGAKPYQSLFEVDNYIGVDYDSPGHPHDNEAIDVYYDGKHLPFENGRFDAVFTSEVLEHVFNPDVILPEINRVMKPGAKLLLTCPFSICEHEVPNDYARYSSFAVKHLLERYGFVIIQQEKTGNSVETVFQLWIMYIHQHILPYISKVPVLRTVFKFVTYGSLNLMAKAFSSILPNRQDLYLNNVVLAEKEKNLL